MVSPKAGTLVIKVSVIVWQSPLGARRKVVRLVSTRALAATQRREREMRIYTSFVAHKYLVDTLVFIETSADCRRGSFICA